MKRCQKYGRRPIEKGESKWAKRDRQKNLNKLLQLLEEQKELNNRQIKEAMNVSDPTLAEYIRLLESQQKIELFKKPEDRRHSWYRIAEKKRAQVETQIAKYKVGEAIGRVENLEILNFLDVFLLEYNLALAEKRAKGESIGLKEISEITEQAKNKRSDAKNMED